MTLSEFFREHPRGALGFSGGADSAYLLYAARSCGAEIQPYYVNSSFNPAFELEDAKRLCALLNVPLTVLTLDQLTLPEVAANGKDRCYHCKRAMFSAIAHQAAADGYTLLLDGANASDDSADRPGMRAAAELSVRSPLRECGITKAALRRLSREAGLFTWDKPAYACLATRIPTGETITHEALEATERAEAALRGLGLRDFRVRRRDGGRTALLQLSEADLPRYQEKREQADRALKQEYETIILDKELRRG